MRSEKWGTFSWQMGGGPERGWNTYTLEVFPPGTSDFERRALTIHRRWMRWGAIAVVAVQLFVGSLLPATDAILLLAATLSIYLGVLVHGLAATRSLRSRIVRSTLREIPAGSVIQRYGRVDLRSLVEELEVLDEDASCGAVTPLEYELEWARIYDRLVLDGPRQRAANAHRG